MKSNESMRVTCLVLLLLGAGLMGAADQARAMAGQDVSIVDTVTVAGSVRAQRVALLTAIVSLQLAGIGVFELWVLSLRRRSKARAIRRQLSPVPTPCRSRARGSISRIRRAA